MTISNDELYLIWEAWPKSDCPLENPFVIKYESYTGEKKVLVESIVVDPNTNHYLATVINQHFHRCRRFLLPYHEFESHGDGLFELTSGW